MASGKVDPAVPGRFAANLRRLREAAGLSQEELAFRADIHRTQVGYIEGGRRMPRLDTLVRLAGSLGVIANDLVDGITWEPFEQLTGGFAISQNPGGEGA
jgi:transcriptional regulator with XRE-family HTH domain